MKQDDPNEPVVVGEFENELKQVLGDIRSCHDIGPDDVVIMGRDGVLLAGEHAINYEELFVAYVSLLVREIFIRNFFVRTFVLDDTYVDCRCKHRHGVALLTSLSCTA